jgi:hypothetical protein
MAVSSLLTSLENFDGSPSFISNNTRYGGGQAASQNTDIIRQGTASSGRRVDNTTTGGFGVSITSTDLSGVGQHVKVWFFVTQWSQLNAANVVLASGSGTGAGDLHTLPSAEWPNNGGFIPIWVDVSRTADSGGPATESAINEVGMQIDIGDVGGNAQNVIVDEIHHGTSGLRWTASGGDLQDFRDFEDTNDIGVLVSINGIDFCYSRLEIGDTGGTLTTFTDSGFTVAFPNQSLVGDSFMGVSVEMQNASSAVTLSNCTVQSSDIVSATKRPDFLVSGTLGTCTFTSVLLLGMRTVDFTSSVVYDGGVLDALNISQGGSEIKNCTINTRSASAVACLTDPTFGTTSGIHDVTFVQQGLGHAIELDTATSYNLTNIFFSGYGVTTANDAAIFVSAASGTVTINVSGGDTPTYRTAGATVVINNSVAVKVTVLDAVSLSPIENARVLLEADSGGSLSVGTDILSGVTNASGVIEDSGFNYTAVQPITGKVRKATGTPYYKQGLITGSITASGFDTNVLLILDE